LRVEEAVWTGLCASLDVFAQPDEAGRQRAEEWLKFFGLETLRQRRVKSLSRGQMRRVLLARAVVGAPALLLLDEPMAGLDTATRRATRELLGRLAATGLCLVMVTHHERDLPERISHVLALKAGRVVFCGERGEYMAMRKARRETDLPHKVG
jgi:molybdate transport system ATP-binding protein